MDAYNGLIANQIPTFGVATLENIEFENSSTPGLLQMKNTSNRQYVRFYEKEVFDSILAKQAGDVSKGYQKKLFVKIVTPGDKNEYDSIAEDYHKRVYFKQYQAFKSGKTLSEGQSVNDCDFILSNEATELIHMGIHTVEQLADASDMAMHELPRGFELREYAKAWFKTMHGDQAQQTTKKLSAELNEAKTLLTSQAQALEEQKKVMLEMQDELRKLKTSQVDSALLNDTAEPKYRKGR